MLTQYSRGFTLIEILLVLVVIAIMAGLVSVSIGPNVHKQLERETKRLQALLQMAADEAVSQGEQWSLALPKNGYQFLVFDSENSNWRVTDKPPFDFYSINSAISLTVNIEGQQLDPQILQKMQKMQSLTRDPLLHPVLLLLSSGEITPFSITLRHEDIEDVMTLHSDGVSAIEILPAVTTR